MSLLRKVFGGIVKGVAGVVAPGALAAYNVYRAAQKASGTSSLSAITQAPQAPAPMSIIRDTQQVVLPGAGAIGAAGRIVRGTVSRIPGSVRSGVGGAVGGAVVGGAIDALTGRPVASRRRRSKGITGRELKAFTRVTGILNKYCKTPAPMKRRTTRSRSCR